MKRLTYKLIDFLFIFIILLFTVGVNLQDNPPPGWYQQTLPVNDLINDIFFLDSLNGWIVTDGDNNPPDTGYILRTTNGGDNWNIQLSMAQELRVIQFLDINTGYTAGGTGSGFDRIYKTTNGGDNWIQLGVIGLVLIDDLYFLNKDTGWICDDILLWGGLYKTTNGGNSWVQQLNESYRPFKLFFINKDTGWVVKDPQSIYKTTNGGNNWNLIIGFSGPIRPILDIFFMSADTGWITRATNDSNGILKTTDGGYNWIIQIDPEPPFGSVPTELFFTNTNTGYIATGASKIIKTTNGGEVWGKQDGPSGGYSSIYFVDSLRGWAGSGKLIATKDGGGPIMSMIQISNEVPKDFILYQNYPNPFNSITIIKFEIHKSSNVKLIVYDVQGKEVKNLINEKLSSGIYSYDWNASGNSSGVYFYSFIIEGNIIDTKKMLLIK